MIIKVLVLVAACIASGEALNCLSCEVRKMLLKDVIIQYQSRGTVLLLLVGMEGHVKALHAIRFCTLSSC